MTEQLQEARDPLALAGDVVRRSAEALDAVARALLVTAELIALEAEARTVASAHGALTIAQVAKELGVGTWVIYRAIKRRELVPERHGDRVVRITAPELQRYRRTLRLRRTT